MTLEESILLRTEVNCGDSWKSRSQRRSWTGTVSTASMTILKLLCRSPKGTARFSTFMQIFSRRKSHHHFCPSTLICPLLHANSSLDDVTTKVSNEDGTKKSIQILNGYLIASWSKYLQRVRIPWTLNPCVTLAASANTKSRPLANQGRTDRSHSAR